MSVYAGHSRDAMRASWREAWQRHEQRLPLEPLQLQMVDLIAAHPEYHAALRDAQRESDGTDADANPFLHLALHLALREQLGTNRPAGIAVLHQRLLQRGASLHEAEHRMIAVLSETLWQAQRLGSAPDERQYLEALQRL
jgi:Domain of unknown function (DUF1841)